MKKPPEEIARSIFAAYNEAPDVTHLTLDANEAHELALAFCNTIRELELANQMLVDMERISLEARTRIENHMRLVGLNYDKKNPQNEIS